MCFIARNERKSVPKFGTESASHSHSLSLKIPHSLFTLTHTTISPIAFPLSPSLEKSLVSLSLSFSVRETGGERGSKFCVPLEQREEQRGEHCLIPGILFSVREWKVQRNAASAFSYTHGKMCVRRERVKADEGTGGADHEAAREGVHRHRAGTAIKS